VVPIGDLDLDGQVDLAVGAPSEGASGAVFVLSMGPGCQVDTTAVPHPSCGVKPGAVKIAPGLAGFAGPVESGAGFGHGLSWLSGGRLVVGTPLADAGKGAIWVLSLNGDGTVAHAERIGSNLNWSLTLPDESLDPNFGIATHGFGDLNGDGVDDLLVGAYQQDVGSNDTGAAYLLTFEPCPSIITHPIVFQSPDDNGVNPCVPLRLDAGPNTLHLYLETGQALSTNPVDVCVQDLGDGSELCAWDVRIAAEGGVAITGFAPNVPSGPPPQGESVTGPPAGMEWEIVSNGEFRANWIGPATPSDPTAGPIKLGDLVINIGRRRCGSRPAASRWGPIWVYSPWRNARLRGCRSRTDGSRCWPASACWAC
jgi:hypothetical protein